MSSSMPVGPTRDDAEGSTGQLLRLCAGYFLLYTVFGVLAKWFTAKGSGPGMNDMEFLAYSTLGGNAICLAVVFARRWYRLESSREVAWGPLRFPHEFLYIVPSGLCTAVVIPTTTLLYLLLPSVMVAMVTMRASIIVVGRIVDAVQIRQGILKKKVSIHEEIAIGFALLAVLLQLAGANGSGGALLRNHAALAVLGSYVLAYLIRIYIMNYYKNTRRPGAKLDNRGFFAVEQIAAAAALVVVALGVFLAPRVEPSWGEVEAVKLFRGSILAPNAAWGRAALAGTVFGVVAFFSVFIFMFKGRTATFAGLVNRLTSLIAGTTATLVYALFFGGKLPKVEDWESLGLILVAVGFLAVAERKRALATVPSPAPSALAEPLAGKETPTIAPSSSKLAPTAS